MSNIKCALSERVNGWPDSKVLQKAKVTVVPHFVSVEQISSHMAQFGHVLKVERGPGSSFPCL
jgi:hypothetical protein